MKKIILITAFCLPFFTLAQYGYRDSNRIGILFGLNQFNLTTSDFNTSPSTGWNVGLNVHGNFYNNWDMSYGIQFSENNFYVETLSPSFVTQDVKYKISGVQITLQINKRIIENHLYLGIGPLFQINGDLKYDDRYENNIIKETTLNVADITKSNKVSFYPIISLLGGIKHVRLNVSYQYGVMNFLNNVPGNFKGNASVINGNIIFYL